MNKNYFAIIWEGKWIILLTTLVGLVSFLAIHFFTPPLYKTYSVLTLQSRFSGGSSSRAATSNRAELLVGLINQPLFAKKVFSKVKTAKRKSKKSPLKFLARRRITAELGKDQSTISLFTYGRTPKEAKNLADKAIELLKRQLKKVSANSIEVQEEINQKLLDPLVEKINKMSEELERKKFSVSKDSTGSVEANIEIARLNRDISHLERRRARLMDYISEAMLTDITSKQKLVVVVSPVASGKSSNINLAMNSISALVAGFVFGVLLVLLLDLNSGSGADD